MKVTIIRKNGSVVTGEVPSPEHVQHMRDLAKQRGAGHFGKIMVYGEHGVTVYGWIDGKESAVNRYDFWAPPFDISLYYGDLVAFRTNGDDLDAHAFRRFVEDDLHGGFDDCDDEDDDYVCDQIVSDGEWLPDGEEDCDDEEDYDEDCDDEDCEDADDEEDVKTVDAGAAEETKNADDAGASRVSNINSDAAARLPNVLPAMEDWDFGETDTETTSAEDEYLYSK